MLQGRSIPDPANDGTSPVAWTYLVFPLSVLTKKKGGGGHQLIILYDS